MEVYLYATMPVWRVIALDQTLYVSSFGKQWEGHESAVYKLAPAPFGALHPGFQRFFEELRAKACRVG